jgi:hypothetical protein
MGQYPLCDNPEENHDETGNLAAPSDRSGDGTGWAMLASAGDAGKTARVRDGQSRAAERVVVDDAKSLASPRIRRRGQLRTRRCPIEGLIG